jgi:hypothetical protein
MTIFKDAAQGKSAPQIRLNGKTKREHIFRAGTVPVS